MTEVSPIDRGKPRPGGNPPPGAPGGGGDPTDDGIWDAIHKAFKRVVNAVTRQKPGVLVGVPVIGAVEVGLATVHASIWQDVIDIPGLRTVDIPLFGDLLGGATSLSWLSLLAGGVTVALPAIVFATLFGSRVLDSWNNIVSNRNQFVFFALCLISWLVVAIIEFGVFEDLLGQVGQETPGPCRLLGTCEDTSLSKDQISGIAGALIALNAIAAMLTGYLVSKIK